MMKGDPDREKKLLAVQQALQHFLCVMCDHKMLDARSLLCNLQFTSLSALPQAQTGTKPHRPQTTKKERKKKNYTPALRFFAMCTVFSWLNGLGPVSRNTHSHTMVSHKPQTRWRNTHETHTQSEPVHRWSEPAQSRITYSTAFCFNGHRSLQQHKTVCHTHLLCLL